MVYVYVLMNVLLIHLSLKFYRALVNPISLYSITWVIITVLYEVRLVAFYDLTLTTWVTIVAFQVSYTIGCLFGKMKHPPTVDGISPQSKVSLGGTIIRLSLLASIGSISNFLIAVRRFGFNLLAHTNQLYAARMSGDIGSGVPYLGAFVYPALIFSGIYLARYGFSRIVILPIVLGILDSLKSGGRLGIFTCMFLFIVPIVLQKGAKRNHGLPKTVSSKSTKLRVGIILLMFILLFGVLTSNRAAGVSFNPYMSTRMADLVVRNPTMYKVYVYLASPLGVLNEFLRNPSFSFGGHTFLTVYNLLNRLGAKIPVSQYQAFYFVPIKSNVGTYIRELVEDFTLPLALVVAFMTGLVFSYNYSRFKSRGSYLNLIWASTFSLVIFFSFFMWNFRSSSMWITIFVGSISGYMLDRKGDESERHGSVELQ